VGNSTAGNLIAKKQAHVASFIDSNILIYAEASDEPAKQGVALTLLRRLKLDGSGVISTQVLQEFANVALRKLRLNAHHVRLQLQAHQRFEVIQVTPNLIHAALDLHQTRSVSFYDALIVAAAHQAGCDTLYSEDLNTAEIMAGVKAVNPFL